MSNTVRNQIETWLDTNDQEFTSIELAEMLGLGAKAVSSMLCILSQENMIHITGKLLRSHVYQIGPDESGRKTRPKKVEKLKAKVALPPGVLSITTHNIDGEIVRVFA